MGKISVKTTRDFEIKKTLDRGVGVFALRDFERGELLFYQNLNKLNKYTIKEIDADSKLDGDHSDYVGHGKYVVDHSPASYMNHSCDPNCVVKMKTIAIKYTYALRNIKKGEELTHDYTLTAVDQFDGQGFWELECNCASKNCRKIVDGDLFKLPKQLQKKYYHYLPVSIKIKYKNKIRNQK